MDVWISNWVIWIGLDLHRGNQMEDPLRTGYDGGRETPLPAPSQQLQP